MRYEDNGVDLPSLRSGRQDLRLRQGIRGYNAIMNYKQIHHAKMKTARRKLRRKQVRWGDKTIIRQGVSHG
jgi:hypothetical protein